MCPAAGHACFTAGHTGSALRDNSTAALTGRRTPRAFVPSRKGMRIPTPVTRSLARNDSASRCSGGQGRPPLRSGYRWRSVRDVVPQGHLFRCAPLQDAVPYGRFSTAYRVYVEEGWRWQAGKASRHGGEIFRPADGKPTTAYRVYVEEG